MDATNHAMTIKTHTLHLCDCGQPANRKMQNSWQCERCISIKPDDYHGLTAGIRQKKISEVSAHRMLMEWKEKNT